MIVFTVTRTGGKVSGVMFAYVSLKSLKRWSIWTDEGLNWLFPFINNKGSVEFEARLTWVWASKAAELLGRYITDGLAQISDWNFWAEFTEWNQSKIKLRSAIMKTLHGSHSPGWSSHKNIHVDRNSISLNRNIFSLLYQQRLFSFCENVVWWKSLCFLAQKAFKVARNHFKSRYYSGKNRRRGEEQEEFNFRSDRFLRSFLLLEAEINHSSKLSRELLFWLFEVVFKYFDMFLPSSRFLSRAQTNANNKQQTILSGLHIHPGAMTKWSEKSGKSPINNGREINCETSDPQSHWSLSIMFD